MLSWETGLQSFCFFCQKSPQEPDLRAPELPAEPRDSDKPVALTTLRTPLAQPWFMAPLARAKQTQKQSLLLPQAVTACLAGVSACILPVSCTFPSLLKEDGALQMKRSRQATGANGSWRHSCRANAFDSGINHPQLPASFPLTPVGRFCPSWNHSGHTAEKVNDGVRAQEAYLILSRGR